MKVTVYNNVKDTTSPQYSNIINVANQIKSGGKQKDFIEELRKKDKEEYAKGKKQLPVICFNGEFKDRSKDGLIAHNGALTLDFDHVKDKAELKKRIEEKPYTILNFSSPSDDGFKTIVRIPKVKSDEEYKRYFKALQKEFPELDESGKDISRCCFFSYDKDIYINQYATEFRMPDNKQLHQVKNWDKVNKALRKIEDSVEGEKHLVRTKIAYLFGGWVASKAMSYADALDLIEKSVVKNTTDFPAAMKTVRDCLMAGMTSPLSINEESQVLDMKVGLGKVYYHMDEVMTKVQEFYDKGYQRGFDTGWDTLDEIYSVMLGTTTIVYAFPYSGKSQLRHELLINLSVNYGLNHVLLTPETGDVEQVFGELISIHAGKQLTGKYKMTKEEFDRSSEFIKRHFFIIDPLGNDFTIRDFFTQVEAIERAYDIKIHTTVIDPLNTVDHIHPSLRSDKAQDKDLQFFNADARKNNRHNCVITHCRDVETRKEKDQHTKEVIREWLPFPKPRDILNGQSFWRNGMNLMGNYRPLDLDDVPLKGHEVNEIVIEMAKVKPKGQSQKGKCSLYYDWQKNRYYEMNGHERRYAKGFTPTEVNQTSEAASRLQGWEKPSTDETPPF